MLLGRCQVDVVLMLSGTPVCRNRSLPSSSSSSGREGYLEKLLYFFLFSVRVRTAPRSRLLQPSAWTCSGTSSTPCGRRLSGGEPCAAWSSCLVSPPTRPSPSTSPSSSSSLWTRLNSTRRRNLLFRYRQLWCQIVQFFKKFELFVTESVSSQSTKDMWIRRSFVSFHKTKDLQTLRTLRDLPTLNTVYSQLEISLLKTFIPKILLFFPISLTWQSTSEWRRWSTRWRWVWSFTWSPGTPRHTRPAGTTRNTNWTSSRTLTRYNGELYILITSNIIMFPVFIVNLNFKSKIL